MLVSIEANHKFIKTFAVAFHPEPPSQASGANQEGRRRHGGVRSFHRLPEDFKTSVNGFGFEYGST